MSWLELRIPPVLLLLCCAAGIIYYGDLPAQGIMFWALLANAAVLIIIGGTLLIRAVLRFMKARTTVNPHTPDRSSGLVTDGDYRFTRNPMYLGMLVILFGLLLCLPSITGGALVALFFVFITRFQILPEERMLEELFGEEYRAYKLRVRRWI